MSALLILLLVIGGSFLYANLLVAHAFNTEPKLLGELMDALWESDCQ